MDNMVLGTAIPQIADRIISALDEKQLPVTIIIYMNLSKAFDTLDHDTLLKNEITMVFVIQL